MRDEEKSVHRLGPPPAPPPASHLDALHRLVDGLQQSPVLRVLVAVFTGKHVSESFNVAVKVLLRHRLLLENTQAALYQYDQYDQYEPLIPPSAQ